MLPAYIIENIIREELSFRSSQSRYFRDRRKEGDIVVPTVYQPVIEPEASALRFIFVEPGAIHLVFNDEIAPDGELDRRYREIRRQTYGRVTDVESIEVAGGQADFRDDASGINVYETSLHYQLVGSYQGAVYTNTWNHLMSVSPQPYIQLRGGYRPMAAEVRNGGREDAEVA
jgi:hypothetical protein